jgi:hypothetical protein
MNNKLDRNVIINGVVAAMLALLGAWLASPQRANGQERISPL